jgi:hypothetical protein
MINYVESSLFILESISHLSDFIIILLSRVDMGLPCFVRPFMICFISSLLMLFIASLN